MTRTPLSRLATLIIVTAVAIGTPFSAFAATFPGENGKVAYASNRHATIENPNLEIYAIDPDGTGETKLTDDPNFYNSQPSWSPDATQIAFTRREIVGDALSKHQIFVMNADGSGLANLSNNDQRDLEPGWSPDASQIVFVRQVGSNPTTTREIYVMNADGSGQTPLTSNGGWSSHPTWSPDGTRIAFTIDGPDTAEGDVTRDVWVMDADGSDAANLTSNGEFNAGPTWSPDGSRIAFHGAISRLGAPFRIFVMNADGSEQTPVTDEEGYDFRPSWSPDGTKIAFHSYRAVNELGDSVRQIYVMNVDGSGLVQLTNTPPENEEPSWGSHQATPGELTEELLDAVAALNLASGTRRSLNTKLEQVRAALETGDIDKACSLLAAFTNEVEAQAGKKKLTAAQADELKAATNEIQVLLGCA